MSTFIDLTGKRFGRWTVVCKGKRKSKFGVLYWLCKCICGKEKEVEVGSLKNGTSKSCGCFRSETSSKVNSIDVGLAAKRQVYGNYKRSAQSRGIDFKLDFELFLDISQKRCYYCGAEAKNQHQRKYTNGSFIYQGIDRKDNNKGYTIDNVVPCCIICNKAKGSMSYEEFKDWIIKMVEYQKEVCYA